VTTARTSMHPLLPTQAVSPYHAEGMMDEEGDDEDEEETVSSTLVVVNPQELHADDDDAASFQLVTPPLLPPQHDLGVSGSGSNTSSTFDPAMTLSVEAELRGEVISCFLWRIPTIELGSWASDPTDLISSAVSL